MSGLIVIDVVIFAVLIMIATVIVVTRARRIGRRYRSGGVAAESAGAGMGPRDTPITPGLHEEAVTSERGAREPAEPDQAELQQPEPEQAEAEQTEAEQTEAEQAELQHAEPEEAEPEQAELRHAEPEEAEPEPAGPEQAGPEQAEPPQASQAAAPDPGRNGSAGEPAGHPAGAGPAAGSGEIGSYYEGADQEIADYLAERGWPEEPGAHDPAGRA